MEEVGFKTAGSSPESQGTPNPGPSIPQRPPHRCREGSNCQPKPVLATHTAEAVKRMVFAWSTELPQSPTYPGTIRISQTGEFRIVDGVASGLSLEVMAQKRKVRVLTMYLMEAMRTVLGYRLLWNRQPPWENSATELCDQQAWHIFRYLEKLQLLGEESDPEREQHICHEVSNMRNFRTDHLLHAENEFNSEWGREAKEWLDDREKSGACFCFK